MTIDELKKQQGDFVEWAKFVIKKDDDMAPISFVLIHHGNIDKLREIGGAVEIVSGKGWFKGMADHEVVFVARPFQMSWKEKFTVLYHALPEDKREMLEMLLEMGKEIKVDDEYMRVCRPLMQVLDCDEKDIASIAVRQLCKVSDAIAVITVMTAWMAQGPEAYKRYQEAGGSLEDFSESIEVLHVVMEAQTFSRSIFIPIERRPSKKRGCGKVTGWGKRSEMSTDETPALEYGGRFAEFLKPLEPKASA